VGTSRTDVSRDCKGLECRQEELARAVSRREAAPPGRDASRPGRV